MKNALLTALLSLILLFNVSCAHSDQPKTEGNSQNTLSATVDFIDVGDGECALITLPDGKVTLIDCGEKDKNAYNEIKGILSARKVDKIDYFILTHPDPKHIGNADSILADYEVGVLYLSKVADEQKELFAEHNSILSMANAKGVEIIYSEIFQSIIGSGYTLLFLSPFQDYFNEVAAQKVPSESTVDDFSPIIYFEVLGKRMIFTGDAGQTVEEKVLSNYLTGIYNHYLDGGNKQINLEKIDLIKLAKGGANGASSIDFLRVLRPDYAVFSVGGANNQSAPSSAVIERLIEVNEKVKLYRTDEDGNITVKIDNNSEILILTEGDNYV